ncbi:hypothetical protein [Wolbachia endosymbiont (group A) of Agelastica alni]|uniref:hypothetical protein n=1 Tax=Wolbachia endosymbiont (group A) of Agelastica alni TaxID=3066130 RepID=UPI00333F8E0C
MKKIRKAIAKKFKNWKTTTSKETATQEPKISSREEAKKPLEIIIEQQPTVVTAETTTAKDENSKEVCKYSVTNKDTTHAIDKATGTDTKLCESEDLQPICESNEEAQIETTVEPTSVDRADRPSSAEPCFDATDEKDKPPTKTTQQRQPIVAGVVGAVLLASGVAYENACSSSGCGNSWTSVCRSCAV